MQVDFQENKCKEISWINILPHAWLCLFKLFKLFMLMYFYIITLDYILVLKLSFFAGCSIFNVMPENKNFFRNVGICIINCERSIKLPYSLLKAAGFESTQIHQILMPHYFLMADLICKKICVVIPYFL